MGWLDAEELKQVWPAESSAFPAPIPTQSVSSDEFMPVPQTAKQREFEARIKTYGADLARRQGMNGRSRRCADSKSPMHYRNNTASSP